jgi:hypothetical protein
MAGSSSVRPIDRGWSLQKVWALLAVAAIAGGAVWFQLSGRTKALIDRVVPPPKAVVIRTAVPSSQSSGSEAEKLLAAGLARAKRESKRVFFHATGAGCHPCFLLDRFLEENHDLFQTDFVEVKVELKDVDFREVANGFALLLRLRNSRYDGVPWIAILEPDGRVVTTSDRPSGKNAGFSVKPEGIRDFMQMLRKGIKRMTPAQLAQIENKLDSE